MPEVVRGVRAHLDSNRADPQHPERLRRVRYDQQLQEEDDSLQHGSREPDMRSGSGAGLGRISSGRRRSAHHRREQEERDAYYDSRAATQAEYRRRASNLQSYYNEHPDLLPQLPFTFRHGFKRWKLGGYISLIIIDACVIPIILYYAMTFGGNIQGYITFAVITAIWGGPTYVEFAVRSLRLIKNERFFKPLGVDKRWAFDITNWILVLTIAAVTSLLIIGAAPHIVFLRVLSMPAPAILYSLSGPIFILSLYSACGWKAPFRISSTGKGKEVLPGVYYIVEDIVAVNAGGGRPFREGLAARYNASPLFRKMMRDQSWFWSIPGLFVAIACTVVVCIHPVPSHIAYGIGWGVPFLWAMIWAAITLPWVRSVMRNETRVWEEESAIMSDRMNGSAPPPVAPEAHPEKPPESSISGETARGREDVDTTGDQSTLYRGEEEVAHPHSMEDHN
ncbi:hypothetical protein BP5796_09663 [Coleophoma crateriformis]|uniref:Uncharacterized protein n=1 Tax=Coleophoma crateriformis TaxID=565419 RepID=A0A3D8QZB8_9HELO|nr:hypothetical protein BP5796_09663 [Coleophoma crateriformis]